MGLLEGKVLDELDGETIVVRDHCTLSAACLAHIRILCHLSFSHELFSGSFRIGFKKGINLAIS